MVGLNLISTPGIGAPPAGGPDSVRVSPAPPAARAEGANDAGRGDRVDLSAPARAGQFGDDLSKEEREQVRELEKRDREVRAHEEAHQRVGGQYAGAPSYDYQTGPDGRQYAVGGEVAIDASPIPGDPDATIEKMRVVKNAALAPAEPSGQDRKVAAQADATAQQAQAEKRDTERAEAEAAARGEPPPENANGLGPIAPAAAAPPTTGVDGAAAQAANAYAVTTGAVGGSGAGGLLALFA